MASEHGLCSNQHPPTIPVIGLSNEKCEIRWCLACGQIEYVDKVNDCIKVLKPGIFAEIDSDSSSN